VIGLARLRQGPADLHRPVGWRPLIDGPGPVGTFDLEAGPEALVGEVAAVRLFSGYAGWAAGQLEDEIDEGSWFVVGAEVTDPVSADPEGLWRRVLRRQGGSLAVVSGFPLDPGAN
jgi:putative transcriptional regulator